MNDHADGMRDDERKPRSAAYNFTESKTIGVVRITGEEE